MNTWRNDQYFSISQPIGTTVRFRHEECGNSREALIVTRNTDGWAYYCHKCGERGFKRLTGLSPKNVASLLHDNGAILRDSYWFPEDFTYEIPPAPEAWLARYKIGGALCVKYKIGWSPKYQLLIFPVLNDRKEVIMWTGRAFAKDAPSKYVTKMKAGLIHAYTIPGDDVCVIVEDILSCIRIAEATGHTTIALLRSSFREFLLKELASAKRGILWLDPDKAKESIGIAMRLSSLSSVPVKIVLSDADPKEYSDDELRQRTE